MFSTMFPKLSLLALAAAPLISALTLHIPNEPTSQETITISWDTAPGDPEAFTIELNHPSFNDALAIANNVDPAQGSITLTIPVVEAQGGYTLEAVNVGNINDVYSVTGPFAIAPPTTSASTVASSTSRTSGASSASSATGSSASSATRPATSGSSPANGSSVGSSASSVSTAPPSVTNLTDNNSSAASVAANIGLLAAVAGAILVL